MHDIDQTRLEAGFDDPLGEMFESEYGEDAVFAGETEWDETSFPDAALADVPAQETLFDEAEYEGEMFDEAEEMELAARLLEITTDEELDQFLGSWIKKAWRGVKRLVKSPVGRYLRKGLKWVAKKALPIAGRVVGGYFGGPAGAKAGRRIARMGGRLFGLELEGLSPEDQEFEIARRYVRFANSAMRKGASVPHTMHPAKAAKAALASAARLHAPGLLRPGALSTAVTVARRRSGRWIRRGNKIIILGA